MIINYMIKFIKGDIFTSKCDYLVNPVNCFGVSGEGLAKEFKTKYPNSYTEYRSHASQGHITLGYLFVVQDKNKYILHFPIKTSWKNPSHLSYIEMGLQVFVNTFTQWNIKSIAFPALGCGRGLLKWKDVKPLMEKYLSNLPINIEIYEPN